MKQFVNLQIPHELREKIKNLKIHPRETYEEVIERVIFQK